MRTFDDPAVIVDIFKRRNLKPKSGCFVGDIDAGECCILTALYCDAKACESHRDCLKDINEVVSSQDFDVAGEFIAPVVGIYPAYANALMEARDDEDIDTEDDFSEKVRLGHIHGRAARKACEAAGMMPPLVRMVDDDEDDGDFYDEDCYDDDDEPIDALDDEDDDPFDWVDREYEEDLD